MMQEIHILSFKDKNPLHIIAQAIRLGAWLNRLPTYNHTALLYIDKFGNEIVFEILKSGVHFLPFDKRKNQYKGEIASHLILKDIPDDIELFYSFEKMLDYDYSASEALGAMRFEFLTSKTKKFFNKLVSKLQNPKNKKTFCNALILKCLEHIEKQTNTKIELLKAIKTKFINDADVFEKIMPADVFKICDTIYLETKKIYKCPS